MTTDYEVLVEEGDFLRIKLYKHEPAIRCYEEALMIGGPSDRHCQQMAGVCSRLLRRYGEAIEWFERALVGASPKETGNILRDMAETYSEMGEHEKAHNTVREALKALPEDRYPVEHGATLGFLARIYWRMGRGGSAEEHFGWADEVLSAHGNRHLDLYNKLHYASFLSEVGKRRRSRIVAAKALRLSRSHGAFQHQARALALLIGGRRLEQLLKR